MTDEPRKRRQLRQQAQAQVDVPPAPVPTPEPVVEPQAQHPQCDLKDIRQVIHEVVAAELEAHTQETTIKTDLHRLSTELSEIRSTLKILTFAVQELVQVQQQQSQVEQQHPQQDSQMYRSRNTTVPAPTALVLGGYAGRQRQEGSR